MPLNSGVLKAEIQAGIKQMMLDCSSKATEDGAESASPESVIEEASKRIADVVAKAVERYVKSGDIVITGSNITVVSPHGPCTVTPATPAKLQ